MLRAAFLFLVCFAVGCGPVKPTPSNEVNVIGVEELCRIYRHNPKDRTFKDCLVQCRLDPGRYRLRTNAIEAHWYSEDRPGCVYFETSFLPLDTSKRLIVTGRVQGIVRDGLKREATTDYYVLVQSCSVTMLEP